MSVKPCNNCNHPIASDAKHCPSCAIEPPFLFRTLAIICGVAFLSLALFYAMEKAGYLKSMSGQGGRPTSRQFQIQGAGWHGGTTKDVSAQIRDAAMQNDEHALESLLKAGTMTGHITEFQDGEIVLLERSTMFGGRIQVRRKGDTIGYWIPREAASEIIE